MTPKLANQSVHVLIRRTSIAFSPEAFYSARAPCRFL